MKIKKISISKAFKINQEFINREEIILRDFLALERTRLANERTLMSYLRTSLYLLLGGIGLLQLSGFEKIQWLGHVCLVLCIISIIVGIYRFIKLNNQLYEFYQKNQIHNENETRKEMR
ncbi:DUF202 domain-containing protein [Flavobacterium sp. '19STA2R22 D10 B1']|uniref:DUF202 domain-containing protein n=1 Tax=Flavobacterium aerium TaxID=3037261 RepID=UPI00278BD24C|nr:DUF202 domain-containing protein [Flavobacterium sp. '19STA2R22 D10 B1']